MTRISSCWGGRHCGEGEKRLELIDRPNLPPRMVEHVYPNAPQGKCRRIRRDIVIYLATSFVAAPPKKKEGGEHRCGLLKSGSLRLLQLRDLRWRRIGYAKGI